MKIIIGGINLENLKVVLDERGWFRGSCGAMLAEHFSIYSYHVKGN